MAMASNPRSLRMLLGAAVGMIGAAVQAKEAIVGGKPISIREAPWQLLLLTESGDGSIGNCAASWLGGKWVLTAAHCVEDSPKEEIGIYAGITRRADAKPAVRNKVIRIISQPDYPRIWKDIAVLELEKPITASEAKPIRMASPQDVTAGYTRPGVAVMATGWGGVNRNGRLADTLQMVMSKVSDTTRWTLEWAGLGGTANIGSCGGDSGGPCVVKDGTGAWILAGISSTISSFCGDPNSPSSYTKVSAFHSWVTGYIGSVVGIRPLQEAGAQALLFPGEGRFTLQRPQVLDVTFSALNGAILSRSRKFYAAGNYPMPAKRLSGAHVLSIRGDGVDFSRRY